MFDIPSHDDPRIMVSISIPVKGRKPLVLRLPRFDFIGEDQHDELQAAVQTQVEKDPELPLRKHQRLADLVFIKPFVSASEFKACEALLPGQLRLVISTWAEQSSIPLGEFLASAASSPGNTEAPSSTTSIPAAGRAETSDAA